MKIYPVLFLMFFPSLALACKCEFGCLNKDYDIVANIEIISESSIFNQAYVAKVNRLQDFTPIIDIENKSIEIHPEEIILVDYGVGVRKKTDQIDLTVNSCGYHFKVGERIHLFANRIESGFYETTTCSCTTKLN